MYMERNRDSRGNYDSRRTNHGNERRHESRSDREGRGDQDREDRNRMKKMYIYKEGDWICPNSKCRNKNFARRVVCNLCETPRPDESKPRDRSRSRSRNKSRSRSRSHSRSRRGEREYEDRRKSRPTDKFGNKPGLFKEGDWRCEKCNNVNFSWRMNCNICKETKENSGKEERQRERKDSYRERDSSYRSNRMNNNNSGYIPESGNLLLNNKNSDYSKRFKRHSSSRSPKRNKRIRSPSASSLFSSKSDSRDRNRRSSYRNKERSRRDKRSKSRSRDRSPSASPYQKRRDQPLSVGFNTVNTLSTFSSLLPDNNPILTANQNAPSQNVFDLSLSMMKNHFTKSGDLSDNDSIHKARFIQEDN